MLLISQNLTIFDSFSYFEQPFNKRNSTLRPIDKSTISVYL